MSAASQAFVDREIMDIRAAANYLGVRTAAFFLWSFGCPLVDLGDGVGRLMAARSLHEDDGGIRVCAIMPWGS